MGDIQRGVSFTTNIPDAVTLQNLVDQAIILPAFISAKTVATPASGDAFVFLKGSGPGVLRQCTLAGLISAFPANGAANVASLRKLGTNSTDAAAGNDPRFPARLTGIRFANGPGPDTVASVSQLQPIALNLSGQTNIAWNSAIMFSDSLTANKTYTFSNTANGKRIIVAVKLNGHTATFPAVQNGTVPVIGSGTTVQTYFFLQTPLGTTGFCIAS